MRIRLQADPLRGGDQLWSQLQFGKGGGKCPNPGQWAVVCVKKGAPGRDTASQ